MIDDLMDLLFHPVVMLAVGYLIGTYYAEQNAKHWK